MDFQTALEGVSKYETEMVYWLSEIRLLADRSLDTKGSIMDGHEEKHDMRKRHTGCRKSWYFGYKMVFWDLCIRALRTSVDI